MHLPRNASTFCDEDLDRVWTCAPGLTRVVAGHLWTDVADGEGGLQVVLRQRRLHRRQPTHVVVHQATVVVP